MDRETKLNVLRKKGWLYKYPELQDDKEAVLIAIQSQGRAYKDASPEMQADLDVRLAVARGSIFDLEVIPLELRDKDVMMAAVQNNGAALQFASPELRGDKELVMVAVQHGFALRYASPVLRADKEVVMAAVKHLSIELEYASPELRADKEVVMSAVQKGEALLYASPELRGDKEVVLASVHKTPHTIHSASAELQRDEDVIRTSLRRDYVSEGHYHNIHVSPVVGDAVTLVLKVPQTNPVVHRVASILPDGRLQLNNNTISTIYVQYLNLVPKHMLLENRYGLQLRDRTFTIKKGGKHKKLKYGSKRIKRSRRS